MLGFQTIFGNLQIPQGTGAEIGKNKKIQKIHK
jgi:hypothetical protein